MALPVLSVDLAYKRCRDIGIAVLESREESVRCDFIDASRLSIPDPLEPKSVAAALAKLAEDEGVGVLLIDGPQGWKSASTDLVHSRRCERELNTPAKSGLPGNVKPANYGPFVAFSIAVYDELDQLGWRRCSSEVEAPYSRTVIGSFPLSAWRSLGIKPLPSKAKCKAADLNAGLSALYSRYSLKLNREPNHDELQALVAGLGGISLQANDPRHTWAGVDSWFEDGTWREGRILNPKA